MTLVSRRTSSGLVTAEYAVDEAAMARALKQIDDRLVLWPPDGTSPYYRVMRAWSDEHPAAFVCNWSDPVTRDPLRLSSGLIDKVQQLRLDGRYDGPDADEHNARHVEQVRKLQDDHGDAIKGDFAAKLERSQTTVSLGAAGTRPSYLRNRHLPERIRKA